MFNPERYQASVEDYESNWRALDDELYGVCSRHPSHQQFSGVVAKVYIVGLSYTTQIARHVTADGTQGGALLKVIQLLHENAGAVDAMLSELRALSEEPGMAGIRTIGLVHQRLVELLCAITRNHQRATSFASKYLHFHCPVVPIYDSVAVKVIPKLIPDHRELAQFPDADANYGWYLSRFFALFEDIDRAGLKPTVKHLDNYLCSHAGDAEAQGELGTDVPKVSSPS